MNQLKWAELLYIFEGRSKFKALVIALYLLEWEEIYYLLACFEKPQETSEFDPLKALTMWKKSWVNYSYEKTPRLWIFPVLQSSSLALGNSLILWPNLQISVSLDATCRVPVNVDKNIHRVPCAMSSSFPLQPFFFIIKYTEHKKLLLFWSSRHGAAETNPTRNHEIVGSIPGLAQWVKDLVLLWAVV